MFEKGIGYVSIWKTRCQENTHISMHDERIQNVHISTINTPSRLCEALTLLPTPHSTSQSHRLPLSGTTDHIVAERDPRSASKNISPNLI